MPRSPGAHIAHPSPSNANAVCCEYPISHPNGNVLRPTRPAAAQLSANHDCRNHYRMDNDRVHPGTVLITLLFCAISQGVASAQNVIPFGATLSGPFTIPTNTLGVTACGRLWFDGTNSAYRFVGGLGQPTIEIRGPAGPGTNGPLLHVLPFSYIGTSDDYCRSAEGLPSTNSSPYHPPLSAVNEGTITITPEQIEYLVAGLLYADRVDVVVHNGMLLERRGRGQITLLDSDNDGVPDFQDQCPDTPAGSLINSAGCSISQLCPCEAPWRNHGQFLKCMRDVLEDFSSKGLITPQQRRDLLRAAIKSDCGKRQHRTH